MCVGKGRLGEISFIVFFSISIDEKKSPLFSFFPKWNIKSVQVGPLVAIKVLKELGKFL